MEKITLESIEADQIALDKLNARSGNIETPRDERASMKPEIIALTSKIKYDKMILDSGNKTGKNGDPLLVAGDGYEVTLNA